ncbi:MAG TPA: Uma2 family endonuclease [Bryobacteraceae bacterium]|jgi:Uma2 family endonuclease|nr:Uma2 family endonuclease [Bryobacteraceae bacterium]
MNAKTLISVEDFDRLEEEEFRYELDEGELITLTRPGTDHGRIERRLLMILQTYLDNRGTGEAFGPDILFVLGPNTKRAPDVSVVLREVGSVKEIAGAPEIAAEILSPSNTKREMKRKLGQFFATGCKLAWIVDPKTRTVEVWESAAGASRTLRESDPLETPLLPGFNCPIAKLF